MIEAISPRDRMVIALDAATATGYAVRHRDGLIASGTEPWDGMDIDDLLPREGAAPLDVYVVVERPFVGVVGGDGAGGTGWNGVGRDGVVNQCGRVGYVTSTIASMVLGASSVRWWMPLATQWRPMRKLPRNGQLAKAECRRRWPDARTTDEAEALEILMATEENLGTIHWCQRPWESASTRKG